MVADFVQRAEIHLDQHRDDHHPDQQADRNIDPGDFHFPQHLEGCRQILAEADAGDDAEKNPDRQIALESGHRRAFSLFGGDFALN
jgi:hypothetical protein